MTITLHAIAWQSLLIMGRDSTPYKVTAICKDVPENSHLSFDILASYVTLYTGPDCMEASGL